MVPALPSLRIRSAGGSRTCATCAESAQRRRATRDRFVEFGIPPERITVSINGVDRGDPSGVSGFSSTQAVAKAVSRSAGDHGLRLGFLGSLMISKAPHLMLEAASRLPRGSVSVDLFGACSTYHDDDSYREQLEPWLRGYGVRVHGAIAHEQVPEALASIDVLVVPSIWPENAPLVIQEAFLAGIPVVASRIGGIPEMVTDGKNGLLFRAGDVDDLSRTFVRLLHEPGLMDRLRSGIPPVRSIHDDVQFARRMYSAISTRPAVTVKRLAAVVLNYRTPDQTLLAVKSLLASRRPIDHIIVVNNDSHDDTRDALKDVWAKVGYLHTGRSIGFSGGTNVGIREALARGAERVVLVNSDVIVPPDAVERLESCLDAAPRAGIAGPVVLARSEPDRIASLGMSYVPSTGRMRHRGYGHLDRGASVRAEADVVDGVSGCFMMVKREVFDAVGLFGEVFFSFEDLDFCLKARRAGFASVLAGRATVYHEGGQSLGATSPRRFYFAARNHLLMARRAEPFAGRFRSSCRTCSIVTLNLAHAVVSRGGSLPARFGAALSGIRDYFMGRFGAGP